MSERLLLRIFWNHRVIKTSELVVSNRVVLLPCNDAVAVGVELRETLFGVVHGVFSVDMLDPQRDLLCGENTAGLSTTCPLSPISSHASQRQTHTCT